MGKIVGNAQAADSFCAAVEAAEESGTLKGSESLQGYINQQEIGVAGKGPEELPGTTTR